MATMVWYLCIDGANSREVGTLGTLVPVQLATVASVEFLTQGLEVADSDFMMILGAQSDSKRTERFHPAH